MKKNYFYFVKICFIVITAAVTCSSQAFSQGNTLRLTGNNNFDAASKVGPTNNADFKIISRDSTRMTVTKGGNVIIEKDLFVKGKVTGENIQFNALISDSMKISQYLTADSIHTRTLVVGDSSLWLNAQIIGGGGLSFDQIQSTFGILNFMRRPSLSNMNTSDIRVGIGLTAPNYKLQLHDRSLNLRSVYASFTNTDWMSPNPNGTGTAVTDGFLVGIAADGTAELRQQEDLDMSFYAGSWFSLINGERIRIDGANRTLYPPNLITSYSIRAGNVGIGNNNPTALGVCCISKDLIISVIQGQDGVHGCAQVLL